MEMENANKILKVILLTLGLNFCALSASSVAGAKDFVGLWNNNASKSYLKYAHRGGNADRLFRFGPMESNWLPLAGDWDGDGRDSVGLFDPLASRFYLTNTHSGGRADRIVPFGPVESNWLA